VSKPVADSRDAVAPRFDVSDQRNRSDPPPEVIRAFTAGDSEAFAAIVQAYDVRLRRLARCHTGDPDAIADLLQETWLRVWEARSQFDSRGSLWAWIVSIRVRVGVDQWRSDARRRTREARAALELAAAHEASLDDALDVAARSVSLERAVDALPYRQRAVVRRRVYDEWPVAAIASNLQCAQGTVRATLTHATRRLRSMLTGTDRKVG
jgi:RNA polymerase sigma-70 factor (ECF subfamily)